MVPPSFFARRRGSKAGEEGVHGHQPSGRPFAGRMLQEVKEGPTGGKGELQFTVIPGERRKKGFRDILIETALVTGAVVVVGATAVGGYFGYNAVSSAIEAHQKEAEKPAYTVNIDDTEPGMRKPTYEIKSGTKTPEQKPVSPKPAESTVAEKAPPPTHKHEEKVKAPAKAKEKTEEKIEVQKPKPKEPEETQQVTTKIQYGKTSVRAADGRTGATKWTFEAPTGWEVEGAPDIVGNSVEVTLVNKTVGSGSGIFEGIEKQKYKIDLESGKARKV
ncbi:MAG: hypothetical protein WC759_00375 [Candidatus Micrarchaeia archaeon]|jgi:hypothetical protein